MNKLVSLWNKHEQRNKYEGPDTVTIDGRKIQVEGIDVMAARKKPHTTAVLDNDAVKKDKNTEKSLIVHELSNHDFNSLISYILTSTSDRSMELRVVTHETLKRLRIKRNESKARVKIPKGVSIQVNTGSIIAWMRNIERKHKKSLAQLVVIDATVVVRTE